MLPVRSQIAKWPEYKLTPMHLCVGENQAFGHKLHIVKADNIKIEGAGAPAFFSHSSGAMLQALQDRQKSFGSQTCVDGDDCVQVIGLAGRAKRW